MQVSFFHNTELAYFTEPDGYLKFRRSNNHFGLDRQVEQIIQVAETLTNAWDGPPVNDSPYQDGVWLDPNATLKIAELIMDICTHSNPNDELRQIANETIIALYDYVLVPNFNNPSV